MSPLAAVSGRVEDAQRDIEVVMVCRLRLFAVHCSRVGSCKLLKLVW